MRQSPTSWRARPLLLTIALVIASCGSDSRPNVTQPPTDGEGVFGQWVASGGLMRTYSLFVPDNPDRHALPLLIVLHGANGSGAGMRSATGLDGLAAQRGFVVVYPDGVGSWASGLGTVADLAGVDDVAFIRTLITHLAANLPIDRNRVHVAGFSDGGTMSYRLGCALTDQLASITAVASGVPIFEELYGTPSQPLAAQMIGGTEDSIFPWQNVRETARLWALLNGCSTTETETLPDSPADDIVVHRTLLGGCQHDASVQLYIIEGMGHTWPGATWDPSIVSFSASEAVMDFAAQHVRAM
jgi:polyhydroxybutyrate depolymerase